MDFNDHQPLTKRQIFGCDQIESIRRQKLNFVKMAVSLFDIVEKSVGKGENTGYQHFLLFPQCFLEGH